MKIVTFISAILLWSFVICNCGGEHHIQKRGIDFEKIWGDIKKAFPGGDKCIKVKDITNVIKDTIKRFTDKVMESFDAQVALNETQSAKEEFIALAEEYFNPERILEDFENRKKTFLNIAGRWLNTNAIMKEIAKK